MIRVYYHFYVLRVLISFSRHSLILASMFSMPPMHLSYVYDYESPFLSALSPPMTRCRVVFGEWRIPPESSLGGLLTVHIYTARPIFPLVRSAWRR